MRFCIINLGCKVNRVESDSLTAQLVASGACLTPLEEANVILINTCTVTEEADKKTKKAVRRALRQNSQAYVLVTGCAVSIEAQVYEAMSDRIVVEIDKSKVVEKAWKMVRPSLEQNATFLQNLSLEQCIPYGEAYRTRVGIKVQDGCNQSCSYCIVHKARGKSWSRPLDEILSEVKAYEDLGAREIVLSGINLGSYSSEGKGLAELLNRVLDATSKPRFRLSSIEPNDVTAEVINILQQARGRLCRHIHLPVQSGSLRILKEMRRSYDVTFIEDLVGKMYAALPTLSLTTDIIVGFPGESDEDFEATKSLIELCRFSKVHVFPYSKRQGTPAAMRLDQVDQVVKRARSRELSELSDKLRAQDYAARCGTYEMALVEKRGMATTESYHQIAVHQELKPGSLVTLAFH